MNKSFDAEHLLKAANKINEKIQNKKNKCITRHMTWETNYINGKRKITTCDQTNLTSYSTFIQLKLSLTL